MMNDPASSYELAVRDFQRARREATMRQLLSRLRGKSDSLLGYDEVRQQLSGGEAKELGIQEIALDQIVGSVGRYQDFTRDFLPKNPSDQDRWANVKAAITDMKGMPPIEVYQLGEVYFVKDGNHRVSVARQLGTDTITAQVTEVKMRVPLTADDDPNQVICKARYADFLERTNIDRLRPEVDLLMTFCGQYQVMLAQIETECRLLSDREHQDECSGETWERAVVKWYDQVYLPIIQIVRDLGVMRRFPNLTEPDIYILLTERREELEEALGWQIDLETAVPELIESNNRSLLNRILDTVAPAMEEGPEVGRWRQQQLSLHREHHLFEKILVLLEGNDEDWKLLDQVLRIAKKDNDHILGLHVVHQKSDASSDRVIRLQREFEHRCQAAGLRAEFAVETGWVYQAVVRRSAWVDLVVINLTDPPKSEPFARLRSGWGTMIQQCPRPILALPHAVQSAQDRILLAYDGSPKAEEALFVAAYLTLRWERSLTVLTVKTNNTAASALDKARQYLEQYGVTEANYVLKEKKINEAILATAAEFESNLLILGGFGFQPALRLVLGSTVEHMLREFDQAILICR